MLLENTAVKPIGLGARDTLRLEADCACTAKILTSLFLRPKPACPGVLPRRVERRVIDLVVFPGRAFFRETVEGPARRRVGLSIQRRAPIREGAVLIGAEDQELGRVSSGGFSPTLDRPIAMGYVSTAALAEQTPLRAMHRGRSLDVSLSRMPFVEQRYFAASKSF